MEPTASQEQEQGRFAHSSAQPPPAQEAAPPPGAALAPPADLAAVRAIQRRWPRAVPATRVFPRG